MTIRKRTVAYVAAVATFLVLVVSDADAQKTNARKTNADRKDECRKNLNGTVIEHEGGGFTCNAGSYEVSIHCTSGGDCICTGADCDQIGGGGGLGRVGNSKVKILAKLPQKLTSQDKAQVERLVAQSLSAIKAGDGKTSVEKIEEVRALMSKRANGSPWQTCGAHCNRHLDDGDAAAYAVCYWSCVINGGPKRQ